MSRSQRRAMIDREEPKLSLVRQCALLGISRSSLYYLATEAGAEDLELMALIDQQYLKTPFYGSRRMTAWLRNHGHQVLMASDSILPNWSAKMSDHGDINVDAERTGKTSGAQQPAGRAYDYGPGGDSNGSEHTPHQAHPGGLP